MTTRTGSRGGVSAPAIERRRAVGAEVQPDGVHFRVWAPRRTAVDVVVEGSETVALGADGDGYFSGLVAELGAGARYRYRVDGGDAFPDPASRYQPDGPHGPSQVVDPATYPWDDDGWHGISIEGQVISELHVGTFTPEGTWRAAIDKLPLLADVGITAVEVMPVADFPGRFGWGYDGVNLFAPTRLYGTPDDFRAFVDAAHAVGLGVILDVVYNHFGPDGNYLRQFAEHYFTDRHVTQWGEAINFDDTDAGPVREYFLENAAYWIDEFHVDGLRLDATQAIQDDSPEHILRAIGATVRDAARGRGTMLIAEDETQRATIVRPGDRGGFGLDGLWNDDYHHAALVALTGRREAYYTDYHGTSQELVSTVKWGYLYQGQRHRWEEKRRGSPALDVSPAAFVNCLENHDQLANSARGERVWQLTSPGRFRALTALTLLGPGTPMLFMGQEFSASAPFLYFADHGPDLAALVRRGRAEFLGQFASLALAAAQRQLADPESRDTLERCRLDWTERERHPEALALHRDLIRLRHGDPVFRRQRARGVDGAVLGPNAFVLRWLGDDLPDRLLIVNLGADLSLYPAPEPLLAPMTAAGWRVLWSSEDTQYGGGGTRQPDSEQGWLLPGESAIALAPA